MLDQYMYNNSIVYGNKCMNVHCVQVVHVGYGLDSVNKYKCYMGDAWRHQPCVCECNENKGKT